MPVQKIFSEGQQAYRNAKTSNRDRDMIITRNIHRRLIAALCCFVGIAGFEIWGGEVNTPKTRFLVRPTRKPDTPAQDRDLSEYKVEAYDPSCAFPYQDLPLEELRKMRRDCAKLRKKAREFVFTNWKEKRKAYLVINNACNHCPRKKYLFIESDKNGRWNMVLRQHVAGNYPSFDASMYNQYIIQAKWRLATEEDFDIERGETILSFINERGDEVATL